MMELAVINSYLNILKRRLKEMTLKEQAVKNLLLVKINIAENALLEFEAMLEEDDQLKQKILEVCNHIAELRQYTI